MASEFWLDDQQWAVIAPLLPANQPGAHRTDDRRVISGIIYVLRSGCRWQDCPACYGPSTTVYNRFHRWSAKGIWRRLFEALVQTTDRDLHMIDSTTAKAHRSAAGGKRGRMPRQSAAHEAADRQKSMLLSMVAAVQLRCE
ncbi:transposase [Rhizobium sp. BK077]|uniref:IS5 family transposase n=1 Tax=unclassified Rhizobium TaxID=2613769 RepID=UPI001613A9FE|nr:transposase [Rhizobium sp. BK112]MBB3371766.1 transposase [Rhizobium sp. BK077]MBB4182537.1 transposase [Rhizobium sp. BK109]